MFIKPLMTLIAMGLVNVTHPLMAEVGSQTERVPFRLAIGKKGFEQYCSSCHGQRAVGAEQGPPLIHKYYEPSHHGDSAFLRAVLTGVKQHHWQFGDMPAVVGVTARDAEQITQYIRWLQQRSGIF